MHCKIVKEKQVNVIIIEQGWAMYFVFNVEIYLGIFILTMMQV